jgi:hypothetical protein
MELGHPFLLFVGEYLREYGDEFLATFRRAMKSPELEGSPLRLLLIGNRAVNQPLITPLLEKLGLTGSVDLLDHMPQALLYRYIRGAVAAVLIPGDKELWWANFAKLVDYIALGVPVLAMVPDPSEARNELLAARLGVFLDGSQEEAARKLREFLGSEPRCRVNSAVQQRYLASSQVRGFSKVFENMLAAISASNGPAGDQGILPKASKQRIIRGDE